VLGLGVALYLAVTRPISPSEAALWQHLVRPPLREAAKAADAWSGLFYALLAERAVGLFRLSEFSLRLPALLSGAVCAWLVWRTPSFLLAIAYAGGVAMGWFSTAVGHGLALGLWCLAVMTPRFAGWLFGLAVTASPPIAALGIIWWKIRDIERVLIPAAATALILLLIPASHSGPRPSGDSRPDFYRELNRRNTASSGAFQPLPAASK
jgi:hypothetical protein